METVKWYYIEQDKRYVESFDTLDELVKEMAWKPGWDLYTGEYPQLAPDTHAVVLEDGARIDIEQFYEQVRAYIRDYDERRRNRIPTTEPPPEYEGFDGQQWEVV